MAEKPLPFRGTATDGPIGLLPAAARLSLRIKGDGTGASAGAFLDLPINRFSATNDRMVARLGPDEWLVIDAAGEMDWLRAELAAALAARTHAIVDVSHASVAFTVEGGDAANILNAGCPLDLDIRAFPAGSATRTLLGKCEIVLFRLSELVFRVECARSFGAYLQTFLLEAAELNVTTGAH